VQKLSLNFINKVLIKNNLSVNQNILGTAFKKDIGIAKEWLQKNKNLFSGVIQLPLYLTMEAKKKYQTKTKMFSDRLFARATYRLSFLNSLWADAIPLKTPLLPYPFHFV